MGCPAFGKHSKTRTAFLPHNFCGAFLKKHPAKGTFSLQLVNQTNDVLEGHQMLVGFLVAVMP